MVYYTRFIYNMTHFSPFTGINNPKSHLHISRHNQKLATQTTLAKRFSVALKDPYGLVSCGILVN